MSQIVAYNEFRAQLAELKEINSSTFFNYEDPKGNKEARSHIYKLRQSKAAVEKVRKAEKAASLEYGRQVDAQAQEIVGELERMIQVHQEPLDRIEQRERERIEKHQARLAQMRNALLDIGELSAAALRARLAEVESIAVDEAWQEFMAEAGVTKDQSLTGLKTAIAKREKYEAEQAELARLRQEAEERARREREERIAKEAEERARAEAERAAQAERDAAARRELELKLQAERAQREKQEAEQRAANAARETEERLRREQEAEAKRIAEEAEARAKDKAHRAAVNKAAAEALLQAGITIEQAQAVVVLIVKKAVPAVSLTY